MHARIIKTGWPAVLKRSKAGIKCNPSTALRILTAGVRTPSPKSSEIPINVRNVTSDICFLLFSIGTSSSFKTIVPPSPFLPRLIASQAYSTKTKIIKVQTTKDAIPMILSRSAGTSQKIAGKAYKGLVPMSPNTTPKDFIASAQLHA